MTATDKHNGWTIAQESEYGNLWWVLRRPDGSKYGMTPSEAGVKIMRLRAIIREEGK